MMSLYKSGDRILKWRYCVSEVSLLFENEKSYSLPNERVSSISILDDYEKNVYPIFRIELILEPSVYYKIIKNKNTVKFHLRIQKYYHLNDNISHSLKRDFINDTFNLILDDEDSDLINGNQWKKSKYNFKYIKENDKNDIIESNNKIEFFLFKTDVIKGMNNTNINTILNNCTISDAVCHILSTAEMKNILMSPAHNNNIYESIIIPPTNCLRSLKFIDTYYGIYKTGSLIYFGLDYGYILQYSGQCTAYRKGEIQNTNIIIPSVINDHTTECCTISSTDQKNNQIVADYRTLKIRNDSISNDIISSNNIELVDPCTGEITLTKGSNTTSNYKNIFENNTENPWIGETYVAQTNAIGTVVDLLLMDYDINMISPNKKFNLVFEDPSMTSKYNGSYILTSANHKFAKDGADFSISTVIHLKRTK